VAASTATTTSSPPPPTPTLEHGKILNLAKIVQLHKESVSTKNKEIDIKNENHNVPKLEDSFTLVTKYDNAEIGDKVLNLFTTHAIIEQYLVDTKSELPLPQNCSAIACDKEELCDTASIIHTPQLANEIDSFILEQNTCAKNKELVPIATEQDELKLLSSLNTLGYIEFETLCALSSLEEEFNCAELPWLSRCTYHFIGKYNCKGEYMVQCVYFCLNLKSPFVVQ
jgi:hypothetical protein